MRQRTAMEQGACEVMAQERHDFNVVVASTGNRCRCAHNQAVLNAMIAARNPDIPVGCRNGGCGVCRIRVVSGRYLAGPMSRAKISPAEERDGVVLACRICPRSDLVIEPLPHRRASCPVQ